MPESEKQATCGFLSAPTFFCALAFASLSSAFLLSYDYVQFAQECAAYRKYLTAGWQQTAWLPISNDLADDMVAAKLASEVHDLNYWLSADALRTYESLVQVQQHDSKHDLQALQALAVDRYTQSVHTAVKECNTQVRRRRLFM